MTRQCKGTAANFDHAGGSYTSTMEFKDEDPKLIEDMLQWLYTNEYPNPSTEKHDAVDFVDAAKLYALADRHNLSGLKQDIIAFVEKFLDLEALDNIEDSFGYVTKLLKIVYTTTPRTDRGIRDVLIRLVWYGREWLLNSEGAQKDVLEIDSFAKGFLNVSIKSCRPKRVSPKLCARCKRDA